MQYSHAFALVQVSLSGDEATQDATVTLQNVFPTAVIDLQSGEVGDATGTQGTVAMKAASTNTATALNYRAIVPAQTITANTAILTTTSNGTNYRFSYSADVPYEEGKLRQINVTLGTPSGSEITIDGADDVINDWEASTDVEGEGSVEEVVNPVTSVTIPITAATNATEAGKYASNNQLSMDEDGWFTRYTSDYGANLTFAEGSVSLTMPASPSNTGWNNCSFGYHITGPFVGTYQLNCTVNATNASRGGLLIRTSNDDLAFALGYQDGYRTIHSFTANGTDQNITCTVNFAQKNTGNPNANVTAENWVATENEDYTDVYIYFYNQTGEATMTISNISLEAVTTTEE